MANKEELKGRFVEGYVVTAEDMHELIDVAGVDGQDGADGTNGTDGDDGFGTQEQYDAIIQRLENLERVDDNGDEPVVDE